MAQHGLYQPKIADEHIRQLSQWAKRLEIPMTRLVNALLAHGLERLTKGVENVRDPPQVGAMSHRSGSNSRPSMAHMSEREQMREGLLGDCLRAMETVLMSPDLNLDCLEQATQDATEAARQTVQAIYTALNKRA